MRRRKIRRWRSSRKTDRREGGDNRGGKYAGMRQGVRSKEE